MVNFNSLSSSDDARPEPESFHAGFEDDPKRKKDKKKRSKSLAGAALGGGKTEGATKNSSREEVVEKSKSIFERLLEKDAAKNTEDHPETRQGNREEHATQLSQLTSPEEQLQSASFETPKTQEELLEEFRKTLHENGAYGGEVVAAHEKPVVSADEATEELQKTVETTKHAEEVVEQAQEEIEAAKAAADPEVEASYVEEPAEASEDQQTTSAPTAVKRTAAAASAASSAGAASGRGGRSGGYSSGNVGSGGRTGSSASGNSSGQGGSSGSAGGGSGTPPPLGGNVPFPMPMPGSGPNTYNTYPPPPTGPNVLTPRAVSATAEADDAYYRGRRRGLVTGLLVGGGIEHIRHRRREKRMNKQFAREQREQTKTHEKALEDIKWNTVREKEADRLKAESAARFTPKPEQRAVPTVIGRVERPRAEISRETTVQAREEVLARQLDSEEKSSQKTAKAGAIQRIRAKRTEQEKQREQPTEMPKHRIEQSAWHKMEVDKHGHLVEGGGVTYGQEYYKERAHEVLPKTKQHKQQFDEATGEVALVAAALSESHTKNVDSSEPQPKESRFAKRKRLAGEREGASVAGSAMSSAASGVGSGHTSRESAALSEMHSGGNPSNEKPKSFAQSLTSPPTTVGGTIGWFIVLVVLIVIFAIILL